MRLTTKIFIAVILVMTAVTAAAAALKEDDAVMTGAGEDASLADMISLMIPSEDAVTVTADGVLSDFLVPGLAEKDSSGGTYRVSGSPNILIYHTHTTEAYRQVDGTEYEESGAWRTNDEENNIVAVGEVLKEELESYGFTVIHDRTNHEPPKLSTAYDRSLVTMESYLEKYPDIDIFIDLHRDAMTAENYNDFVDVDGRECARMMFVVGKGENFDVAPDYKSNLTFAQSVNSYIAEKNEALVRNICIKSGRYNQHIGEISCLMEIGHNMNTLEQAKNSAEIFAWALSRTVEVDNS